MNFERDWGCRLMERQSEFQRAKRVLEIGGGDFHRAMALAQLYPDKQFISIDFRFGAEAKQNAKEAASLDNLSLVKADLLDRIFGSEVFDFVFSIAVMEHVPQLEAFLAEVFDVLTPRGVYSFSLAPFWTSRTGHHFNHDNPAVNAVLDAYQHIAFDAEGMQAYLAKHTTLPFDAKECVRKIYWRDDISRLSPNETRRIVDDSLFTVLEWSEKPDADFDEARARVAMKAHGQRYSLDDFRVGGVFARLLKS
jgi:ubiquinone/menaquinone biosynthesis C-methylase UbiE